VAFDGFLSGVDTLLRFVSDSEPPIEVRLIRLGCMYKGEWDDGPEGIKAELVIRWGDAEVFLTTDFSAPLWQDELEPPRVQ
jgi:hypothetical protein